MSADLLPDDIHAADELVQLRNDNAALRQVVERVTAERDTWRLKYEESAFRHAQAARKIQALVRETFF